MPTENENQSAQVSGVPPPTACSAMTMFIFWIEDENAFPVNKIECCTDGNVRLVWIESGGESRLRDVWKNDGFLWVKRSRDAPMPNPGVDGAADEQTKREQGT